MMTQTIMLGVNGTGSEYFGQILFPSGGSVPTGKDQDSANFGSRKENSEATVPNRPDHQYITKDAGLLNPC
jgi:hypothetical protein